VDIAEWLEGLGLGQYAPAFAENAIHWDVVPKLTADDLKEIGVAAVGDRRRLLEAIASLGAGAFPAASAAAPSVVFGEAERRQLTVMFCDLVGSTPLSVRFDPEDLRGIIGSYHRCAAETVEGFGGFVARYMGDGILVYFGYPQAHEDDAERATRCGLALVDRVRRLRLAEQLHARIGIATGLVVVGGEVVAHDVVGETPNLAARLQALAAPGTLAIAESTRRQLGALFEIEDLGLQPLVGFTELQRVWRVVGESGLLSRFEALRSDTTPLVGRNEELDLLLRRWEQSKAGEGRVVLISGEPGIGKSRLTSELSRRAESEPHTRLRYFCSPYHQDSALHPFIIQLEHAAGFTHADTVEQKLERLRILLAPGARGEDEITLLAELLSLSNSAAVLNLSPQRKREMLFEALLHQLEAASRSRPALMVFEDAHWIDPTSRELLDLTFDRVAQMPVLLLVTFRPEFQHAWSGQPHVTTLGLNRLGGRDGVMLVEQLAGNSGLPRQTVDEIVARADGVPLFVEELTKAVLESGDREHRVAAVLAASPLPNLAIPATLHASLMARLDRLGALVKELAQIGAVIGREFSYELIERTAQRRAIDLGTRLDQLVEARLLFCRGVAPHSSYLFKHALVQDAAYSTLLRAKRQELHARVAAVIERHFSDVVERQPEVLAHHLTAAGDTERAVSQWLKAGQYAAERSAHFEAIHHFDRGLATLAGLSKGPPRDRWEIELQLARGLSLFTAKGFISVDAGEAYTRARELAEQRGDVRQLFTSVYGLWQSHTGSGRFHVGRSLSARLLELTAGEEDDGLRLQAHHSAWSTSIMIGEPAAAHEHCEAGRSLYDPERHRSHRLLYGGHDPGICAGYMGAQAYWLLGYPERGLRIGREALALAERIGHPLSLEAILLYLATLHLDRGEPEVALQLVSAAEALAAEQRLAFVMEPRFMRGAALSAQGAFEEAAACLSEGLASQFGAMYTRPYGLALLAEALARQGKHTAAFSAAMQGRWYQPRTGCRRWSAELHRLQGIALLGLNRREEGQSVLEGALRIARRQQAKSYELRAATSLARLWGEQGRRAEARELLAPVYGWFTEGFDTADLKDARMLLDELA
jgi:class 3 adenylate cyclase/predicted ATPase